MTIGSHVLGSGVLGGSHGNPGVFLESIGVPFLQVWVNGVDITESVARNSKKINRQLAQRTNQFMFAVLDNFPSVYDEVYCYYSAQIRAQSTNSVTLNIKENCNNMFRVGDSIFVGVQTTYERKYTISSIDTSGQYVILTFMTNFITTPTLGDYVGILLFGGVVVDKQDSNIELLTNQEATITCVDFTKLFDKKSINDVWEDVDARYIINDFCNSTINKNLTLDSMDYADNTALQAEWVESGDGTNPTVTSTLREGTMAGQLNWTFSGGTATFTASPSGKDLSAYVGVSSGTPTKGRIGFWYKVTSLIATTSFVVRIGSSNANYIYWTVTPTTTDWVFYDAKFTDGTIVGTVDFTDCDYLAVVVTETVSSSIIFDGFRVLENKFFRHYPYVEETDVIDDFRVARSKPMEVMSRLSETFAWYWHIDDERYIHFYPSTAETAPFEVTETSDNFKDLTLQYDVSQLINRQVVEGGYQTSTSTYYQVREGDGVTKEWLMKNLFKNLVVLVDRNTSTDTCEAGTTTTNIKATAHGLAEGDYIVNRTRSNAVRQITAVVDVDNFTVETVTGQTTGDTISLFVLQNVGVEGLNLDSGNDFMSNFNQKSIRNAEGEAILLAGEFIQFRYNEVVPILVQMTNATSINAMVSTLGYTDGIFDGEVIRNPSIESRTEAEQVAQAKIDKYGNTIITASFSTYIHGLQEGQQILIQDMTGSRSISKYFLIQQIRIREVQTGWLEFSVSCSTLLYGMLELLQQLLRIGKRIQIDEDLSVNQILYNNEEIQIDETFSKTIGGSIFPEETAVDDTLVTTVATPPYEWGPGGSPQLSWDLGEWG